MEIIIKPTFLISERDLNKVTFKPETIGSPFNKPRTMIPFKKHLRSTDLKSKRPSASYVKSLSLKQG